MPACEGLHLQRGIGNYLVLSTYGGFLEYAESTQAEWFHLSTVVPLNFHRFEQVLSVCALKCQPKPWSNHRGTGRLQRINVQHFSPRVCDTHVSLIVTLQRDRSFVNKHWPNPHVWVAGDVVPRSNVLHGVWLPITSSRYSTYLRRFRTVCELMARLWYPTFTRDVAAAVWNRYRRWKATMCLSCLLEVTLRRGRRRICTKLPVSRYNQSGFGW